VDMLCFIASRNAPRLALTADSLLSGEKEVRIGTLRLPFEYSRCHALRSLRLPHRRAF
jgi:hypothetical protein